MLRRGRGAVPAVGMGLLVVSQSELRRHWRTVLRVMVAPELQGTGAGRILLEGLHDLARELGTEHLVFSVRAAPAPNGSTRGSATSSSAAIPPRSAWPRATTAT